MHVRIEATVSPGGTFLKIEHVTQPDPKRRKVHLFIDSLCPDRVLNAIVHRIEDGRYHDVIRFLEGQGKSIKDPTLFRLKLDAELGVLTPGLGTMVDKEGIDG